MIEVTLIDSMGSDLSVVNAARVSFDKESDWEVGPYGDMPGGLLLDKDTKLIGYLAKHGHWSPFSHTFASFRISAPIFVARQLQKHTVGLSWNEVSRRYVDTDPTFYTPDVWRKRAENVKQGSGEPFDPGTAQVLTDQYDYAVRICEQMYHSLLDYGVCPEQARMVLPQSMMTEFIWTGSLYAFARVCKLRLDEHTQKETREIAEQISDIIRPLFPVSWAALLD